MGREAEAMQTTVRLVRLYPDYAPALALYESLQRGGQADIASRISLRTDPRSRFVRTTAAGAIIARTPGLWWIPTVDRLCVRMGRSVGLVAIIGCALAFASMVVQRAGAYDPFSMLVRVLGVISACFLLLAFRWNAADLYLRFHTPGRWLLTEERKSASDLLAWGVGTGLLAVTIALVLQRSEWLHVSVGLVAGGLAAARVRSAVPTATPSPSDLADEAIPATGLVVTALGGAGLWSRLASITTVLAVLVAVISTSARRRRH